jgi:hypothetical protein
MALASAASAQAIVLEIFKSDVEEMADFQPTGVAVEYQGRPLWPWATASFGLGLRISADDGESLWMGGGLYAEVPLGPRWVTEATLMPGYYDPGSSDFDLGSDLEFQSSLGLGYRINEKARLSLAITHLSNAGTADRNPGRNALALRLRRSF